MLGRKHDTKPGENASITEGELRPMLILSGHVLSYRTPMYPISSYNRYFYQPAVVCEHARSSFVPSLLPNNLGFFLPSPRFFIFPHLMGIFFAFLKLAFMRNIL